MSRFTYSQSMMLEYAVMELSEWTLIQHCMRNNRGQGRDPYDLKHTIPVIRKTAQEHARALIWC